MKKRLVSHSAQETLAFARGFAKTLRGGEVVALIGELGSGKTTFVRGLARALGIREPIRSPTFTLMHVHRIPRTTRYTLHATRLQHFVHVDAYRLKNARELEEIGVGEYLGRRDTVTVIEWADRVRSILRGRVITVRFRHGRRGERMISIRKQKNGPARHVMRA